MENLTSNPRIYLDYNASAPVAQSVLGQLESGAMLFANPSSAHLSGKQVRRKIKAQTRFLTDCFQIPQAFDLVYHSGATEGINAILKGLAFHYFQKKIKGVFLLAETDHSASFSLIEDIKALGHEVGFLPILQSGEIDLPAAIHLLGPFADRPVFLNYTWGNNETGVVWPLDWAVQLKENNSNLFIHVDGAQAPGKIPNWKKLYYQLDAYTFSGHKFGAVKGIGLSIIKKSAPIRPWITGGKQQNDLRSGTENTFGIFSIGPALAELQEKFDPDKMKEVKAFLEESLENLLGEKGHIFAQTAQYRNLNTVLFTIKNIKASILFTALDLEGFDVSTGSACSSGLNRPSRVLMAMGYDEKMALGPIRLSFGPDLDLAKCKDYWEKMAPILKRFLD